MAILTTIGITLLCLGYLVLIFVSLSSKPEQDEKNSESISEATDPLLFISQKTNLPASPRPERPDKIEWIIEQLGH
jgi:hypothetical protein